LFNYGYAMLINTLIITVKSNLTAS